MNDYGIKKQDTCSRKARTCMYFDGPVLFPFGCGLSYTTCEYSNLTVNKTSLDSNDTLTVSVDVKNTGDMAGSEIVQVYVSRILEGKQKDNKPFRQLKGYARVHLEPGETRTVTISIKVSNISFRKKFVVEELLPPGSGRQFR